jgi:hypothetical protein
MKLSTLSKGLLFGASLVLATSAFAGEKAALRIYENVNINGKTIAPGNYQAEWTGSGSDVQLSLRQGKETVATLPAHLATSRNAYPTSGYSTRKEEDGSKTLTTVFFGGKKYTLELAQESAAATAPAKSAGNK